MVCIDSRSQKNLISIVSFDDLCDGISPSICIIRVIVAYFDCFVHTKPSYIIQGYSTQQHSRFTIKRHSLLNIRLSDPLMTQKSDKTAQHNTIHSFNHQIRSDRKQSDFHTSHMYTNNRYLCDSHQVHAQSYIVEFHPQ
eukprot:460602_1